MVSTLSGEKAATLQARKRKDDPPPDHRANAHRVACLHPALRLENRLEGPEDLVRGSWLSHVLCVLAGNAETEITRREDRVLAPKSLVVLKLAGCVEPELLAAPCREFTGPGAVCSDLLGTWHGRREPRGYCARVFLVHRGARVEERLDRRRRGGGVVSVSVSVSVSGSRSSRNHGSELTRAAARPERAPAEVPQRCFIRGETEGVHHGRAASYVCEEL